MLLLCYYCRVLCYFAFAICFAAIAIASSPFSSLTVIKFCSRRAGRGICKSAQALLCYFATLLFCYYCYFAIAASLLLLLLLLFCYEVDIGPAGSRAMGRARAGSRCARVSGTYNYT